MRLAHKVEIQPTPTQQQALLQHAGNRLTQSTFCCLSCGHEAHADLNASINILVAGSCPETLNACGAGVSLEWLRSLQQSAVKQESAVA